MTVPRTASAPLAALGLLAVAAAMLTGCSPEPEPTLTPTAAFASEEEAFAAAEETYRAYNEAGNQRRQGQESPNPQEFLTGIALEGDIDSLTALQEQGLSTIGETDVSSFSGLEATFASGEVEISALVCLDVSNVRLLNGQGEDITPADRGDVVAQEVTLVGPATSLRISYESSAEVTRC